MKITDSINTSLTDSDLKSRYLWLISEIVDFNANSDINQFYIVYKDKNVTYNVLISIIYTSWGNIKNLKISISTS